MIELATIYETAKFAFGSFSWAKEQLKKDSEYAIPRLSKAINRSKHLVSIHRVLHTSPKVDATKELLVDDAEVSKAALLYREKLELNERHAVVLDWSGDSDVDTLRAHTCDFATVLALRDRAKEKVGISFPNVLSAGAVVVCPSARCLLLHKRSLSSATYPGALHVLGGAYKPPIQFKNIDNPGDRMSLEFTMVREVFEESGLIVRRYREPICVMHEMDTGFIQYVHLGVRVTSEQFAMLAQNSEGDLLRLSFDSLSKELRNEQDWVPTGRAQILMWLGLGAPGAGWHAKFNGKTAKEVFRDLVD